MTNDPDPADLLALLDELDSTLADLRAYGETHGIPVIERSAVRIRGTTDVLRENIPGGISQAADRRAEPGSNDQNRDI